ncbi:MAG: hypothetical protein J6Q60_01065 [Bacteroidaceae bacterium]|nr:hypothetical protein [Bacteroidaceae bacterium]
MGVSCRVIVGCNANGNKLTLTCKQLILYRLYDVNTCVNARNLCAKSIMKITIWNMSRYLAFNSPCANQSRIYW